MPHGLKFPLLGGNQVYLVVGPNCWGKDRDLDTAVKLAKSNAPADMAKPGRWAYIVYIADASAYIDDMGSSVRAADAPPARELYRFNLPAHTE